MHGNKLKRIKKNYIKYKKICLNMIHKTFLKDYFKGDKK